MTTVLAAIDSSPAARPVIEAGRALAELTGADLEVVHVREGGDPSPAAAAAAAASLAVPLVVREGPVGRELLAALARPQVVAGAVGARATRAGRRPVGHTALDLVQGCDKPVVVVPPDGAAGPHPFRRLLVPLEGTAASSAAVVDQLLPLIGDDVELVALHVLTPETAPVMDHARWDLPMWGDEFVARHLPPATAIRLGTGPVGEGVRRASGHEDVDLVVLSWSRDMAPGRAAVVRDVLGHSRVPVLLLPAPGA